VSVCLILFGGQKSETSRRKEQAGRNGLSGQWWAGGEEARHPASQYLTSRWAGGALWQVRHKHQMATPRRPTERHSILNGGERGTYTKRRAQHLPTCPGTPSGREPRPWCRLRRGRRDESHRVVPGDTADSQRFERSSKRAWRRRLAAARHREGACHG